MPVKLEWRDGRFNMSEAKLPHGLTLNVGFENIERVPMGQPSWNVWVFGRKLKGRSGSMEEAKGRAESAAGAWLNECLGVLECPAQLSPAP